MRGGTWGVLAPFAVFLAGVSWLGLSGAPDERGFWPILLAALALAISLATDRRRAIDVVLTGMSQPLVALMVMAWMSAGVLGTVLGASGLIGALVGLAKGAHLVGGGYVASAFAVACLMSTSTGTSLGTILIAGPVLYPAGGGLGADPAMLAGAILAGATFGDSISPVSDTTIASSSTQDADIGGTVRRRMLYAVPAGLAAFAVFAAFGGHAAGRAEVAMAALSAATQAMRDAPLPGTGSRLPLVMLLVPAFVIVLLLRKRHMLEGLLAGIVLAVALALVTGLIAPAQLLYIDAARFGARGLIVEGMERGVGASVFTLLLMGLTATLEASGVLARVVAFAQARMHGARGAEWWIVGAMSAAVLLTTHSVVAILTVGRFAKDAGTRAGLGAYRRANLLDVTACTWPFLLPFFIPTILAASVTASGAPFGMPRVSAWQAGVANAYSWGLLVMLLVAVSTGLGRRGD
ncbi:MAG: hypothetical protein HY275_01360 [Gemmatimonadetes bacterium]|nr:hypothetical protein [Gemmatimonadota bacterium]